MSALMSALVNSVLSLYISYHTFRNMFNFNKNRTSYMVYDSGFDLNLKVQITLHSNFEIFYNASRQLTLCLMNVFLNADFESPAPHTSVLNHSTLEFRDFSKRAPGS